MFIIKVYKKLQELGINFNIFKFSKNNLFRYYFYLFDNKIINEMDYINLFKMLSHFSKKNPYLKFNKKYLFNFFKFLNYDITYKNNLEKKLTENNYNFYIDLKYYYRNLFFSFYTIKKHYQMGNLIENFNKEDLLGVINTYNSLIDKTNTPQKKFDIMIELNILLNNTTILNNKNLISKTETLFKKYFVSYLRDCFEQEEE